MRCTPELGGLLHDRVHALAPRDTLQQRQMKRRFTLHRAVRAHRQARAGFAGADQFGRKLAAATIK